MLEIKTTEILKSMQYENWKERVPNNYYVQVLHQFLATGWSFAILKAQLKTDYGGEIRLNTSILSSAPMLKKIFNAADAEIRDLMRENDRKPRSFSANLKGEI